MSTSIDVRKDTSTMLFVVPAGYQYQQYFCPKRIEAFG
jgi:hypothetical protein